MYIQLNRLLMKFTEKKNRKSLNRTKKLSQKEKNYISNQLKPISIEKVHDEFHKLQKMSCNQIQKCSERKMVGNNVVDYFTFSERLYTKGHQNVSFYEFWKNRKEYMNKPYVKNMLEFYKSRNIDDIRKFKYIYNLYFSSISIFRPIMAMDIYCRVNAKRVLDFTMGWGGRLVGACAMNLEAYYGIDLNKHLEVPYKNMVNTLQNMENVHTIIDLQFKNALDVDYSAMEYDTVLTSPPYYDLETYRNSSNSYNTKDKWNHEFYIPLIKKTFASLKDGGCYCLNIPEEIYTNCAFPTLGKYNKRILLKKGDRHIGKYKEYIYIWTKELFVHK